MAPAVNGAGHPEEAVLGSWCLFQGGGLPEWFCSLVVTQDVAAGVEAVLREGRVDLTKYGCELEDAVKVGRQLREVCFGDADAGQ